MRYLDYTCKGMKLSQMAGADFSNIVTGSKNYLALRADFSADWDGMTKVAVFTANHKEYPVLMHHDIAEIPDDPANSPVIRVYIIGRNADGTVIKTNSIRIRLVV